MIFSCTQPNFSVLFHFALGNYIFSFLMIRLEEEESELERRLCSAEQRSSALAEELGRALRRECRLFECTWLLT